MAGGSGFWAQAYIKDQNEAILGPLSSPPFFLVPGSQAASCTGLRDLVITNTESYNNPQNENPEPSGRLWAPGLRPVNMAGGRDLETDRVTVIES